MKKDIIIKPGFGHFEPDKKLNKLIKQCGYDSIWDIEARMDERIIKFIQDKTNKQGKDVVYRGKEDKFGGYAYLSIRKVDTSRLWTIDEYDSAEGIMYLEVVDKDLNFCRFENN